MNNYHTRIGLRPAVHPINRHSRGESKLEHARKIVNNMTSQDLTSIGISNKAQRILLESMEDEK